MPNVRADRTDYIYNTEDGKWNAILEDIKEAHENGRPVLVGTASIEASEVLDGILRRNGIPHQVLNAKNHEQEAHIVAQAGRVGAVTVATNMAGRGTDIILGGNEEMLLIDELRKKGHSTIEEAPREIMDSTKQSVTQKWAEEHQQIIDLGGLYVIGTAKNEARRIDNQLRGRTGRQGDPGTTRFYVSMEDDLMRRFGGDRVKSAMNFMGLEDDQPLENTMVSKALGNAQTKVEAYHFEIRKHLVEYDDVINTHREVIYEERRKVLDGADLKLSLIHI